MCVCVCVCAYVCWECGMQTGSAKSSLCSTSIYHHHCCRAHPRHIKMRSGDHLEWGYFHLYLTVLLSMPPASSDKNRIFRHSWHEAEVGGYYPIECIVNYMLMLLCRSRGHVWIKMISRILDIRLRSGDSLRLKPLLLIFKSPSADATAQFLYKNLVFQVSWNQGNVYGSYGLQLLPLIFK